MDEQVRCVMEASRYWPLAPELTLYGQRTARGFEEGRGKDVAGAILPRLMEYAVTHFSAEEGALEKNRLPNLQSHKQNTE
jgi:hypothetical protein